MISNYRFEDIEMQNSFEEGVTDMIYFPVTDSEDFPPVSKYIYNIIPAAKHEDYAVILQGIFSHK